ncbi:hypothetical protein JHK82_029652 [Glycine max]|uniref:Uncharacterized protein n=2 Tax=Glycine subgen. Soja TaxID=1462606 RepID=K7MMF8_SOYBN|nr:hypothetical protein JHK86_057249 [Glycine max]KAG4914296.1 hypothetical protein JHK87_051853 [Glycine soja]KAG4906052.1 hypothetical protein JHK86_057299 [Glycine max]KAG4906121.1 hypothetical protein JHK86_057343 [Glycine max]KAG4906129.1 hypothetical protein JHK86_057331 [Glycine max]
MASSNSVYLEMGKISPYSCCNQAWDSAFKNSLPAILSCVKIAFRPVLFLSWKRRQEQSLLIHLFANLLVGYPHSVTRIGLWSSYHPAVHQKSGRRRLN